MKKHGNIYTDAACVSDEPESRGIGIGRHRSRPAHKSRVNAPELMAIHGSITEKHSLATGKLKRSQRKLATFHVKCLQPSFFVASKKKKNRTDCHNVLDQKGDVKCPRRVFNFFIIFSVERFPIKAVKFCLKLLPPGNKKHIFVPRRKKKTIMLFNLWLQRCTVIQSNKIERTI